MSTLDLERVRKLLQNIRGRNVTWAPKAELGVWVIEQRARLDQRVRIN